MGLLVWGGLDDVAQALHDAPDIQDKIKIYWIGVPNKKWSTNSYSYIVENFPNLWFIENNASYRGFIANYKQIDEFNGKYYDTFISGGGNLGKDFKNYLNRNTKLGDTPSLPYMMDGNPNDPVKESWGGSFVKFTHSPHIIFTGRPQGKTPFKSIQSWSFVSMAPVRLCLHSHDHKQANMGRILFRKRDLCSQACYLHPRDNAIHHRFRFTRIPYSGGRNHN